MCSSLWRVSFSHSTKCVLACYLLFTICRSPPFIAYNEHTIRHAWPKPTCGKKPKTKPMSACGCQQMPQNVISIFISLSHFISASSPSSQRALSALYIFRIHSLHYKFTYTSMQQQSPFSYLLNFNISFVLLLWCTFCGRPFISMLLFLFTQFNGVASANRSRQPATPL